MVTISEYLSKYKETAPAWLKNYKAGNKVGLDLLLSSKHLFYPGSGLDGTPIKLLNSAEYCHTYVYVDNGIGKTTIINELSKPGAFKGYQLIDKLDFTKSTKSDLAVLAIYEKSPNSDIKGAYRFALLFIKDDAFNVYRRLYSHEYNPSIILPENYMGENAQFGSGSPLCNFACEASIPFLLTNGEPWKECYKKVEAQGYAYEGSGLKRYLYKYDKNYLNKIEKDAEEYIKKHKDLMDTLAD